MLADFTTPDEIRAILGVAESELPDVVIELPLYQRQLAFDLADIAPAIAADYLALPLVGSRSIAQQLFYDCMQVYSAYAVSAILVLNVKMFAPQVITDSKTTLQRAQTDPWADTRGAVEAGYRLMKARLKVAYAGVAPSVVLTSQATLTGMIGVGLAADPVTGS